MRLWMKANTSPIKLLILILFCLRGFFSYGQNGKADRLELAQEYFKRENFEKALDLFEDLKGDPANDRQIFQSYIACLEKLKPSKADAAIRKFLKRYPQELVYFTYQYERLKKNPSEASETAKFSRDKLQPLFVQNANTVQEGFAYFSERGDSIAANSVLEEGIRKFGLLSFWEIRIEQLLRQSNHPAAAGMIVDLIADNVLELGVIQAKIQEKTGIYPFMKELQIALLRKIQKQPSNPDFPSFLAWIYMQKGDYDGALKQYLALDLLESNGGIRCYQLGEFAVNAAEDKAAIRCFETIMQEFPKSQYRFLSQQKCMQLKEQVVKNTFPVPKEDVRALISEYRSLMYSQYLNVWELTMKVAELYGKYLNRPDSAVFELENSMKSTRWPPSFSGKAKILLADMYLLKDEPWEASLLYGQVEKEEAESLTGYEAKLKNARVFYYKGEFELCKEILDVLKQSTSRDISNDAIELALLIQDILAEDTTGFILSKFADIDLLAYQGNYPESIDRIEKLAFTSSNPVVLEKLRFRLFKNYQSTRQFDKALAELDQIYKAKASDLYIDDALYFSGIIYAEQKKDKEKAMEYFLNLIKEKPGSVYIADARKRLRILRGDFAN